MKNSGFSLIEMMVSLSIIGIILSISTLKFNEFSRKCDIECQTKMIYADLMKLRAQALVEKHTLIVKLTPTTFSVYSSENVSVTPSRMRDLKHQITMGRDTINFNERGLAEFSNTSICVDESENSATFDSLVIYTTRIQMGKRRLGKACSSDFISTE